jgi:hypothetical protein
VAERLLKGVPTGEGRRPYEQRGDGRPMNNTPRPRKQPKMTNECRRCGKPERGYDARHSYATQRFEPTRSPSKLGRFCQPCAVEVAHEKNLEHTASRHARHGEVRHLVKEGKEVGEQCGSGETESAGDKSPH